MSSTVVYQETPNNFVDVGQKIKGSQIVSVKAFNAVEPTSVPDFIGQLAICNDPVAGKPLIYMGTLSGTGTSKGWELLNVGGSQPLPDYVVREDSDNNFTVFDQTIDGAQITCVTYGSQSAVLEPIKGQGHFYIKDTNKDFPELYMAVSVNGNLEWRQLFSKSEIDPLYVVYKNKANNFTELDQEIDGHPIATMWSGAQPPMDAGVKPNRAGQIFMQVSESSSDKKAHLWISRVGASSKDFVWEYIETSGDSGSLPATVVRTDKGNNFQDVRQKLKDHQILSFVDGEGRTPAETHASADYDGQLYFAVKTLGTGEKDVAVWVANGNTWVPLLGGLEKVFASLHESNIFSNPTQFLGDPTEVRMISGTRVKRGSKSPDKDANWKAKVEGEQTIFVDESTSPLETSLWTAVKVNPSTSNTGEWVKTWSSNHVQPTGDVAYTDEINIFVPGQMMGESGALAKISVARNGVSDPLSLKLPPMHDGEVYIETGAGHSGSERHIWIGTEEADVTSWVKIFGDGIPSLDNVAFLNQPNLFVPGQKIGTDSEHVDLAGCRVGESPPMGQVIPFCIGETYVQKIRDSFDYTVYIATEANNSASWKKMYDTTSSMEGLIERISELEQAQVGDDARFAEIETEQTDMNKAFDNISESMNGLMDDVAIHADKLVNLDDRLGKVEVKVADLSDLLDKITALEEKCHSLQEQLDVVRTTTTWMHDNLTSTRTASHPPLHAAGGVNQAVEYAGELFIETKSGGGRQVWLGVQPDREFAGSDWIKLSYAES